MCSDSSRMGSERSDPEIPAPGLLRRRKRKKLRQILDSVSMKLHNLGAHADDDVLELSPSYRARLMNRNKVDQLKCAWCGLELQVGDPIHVQHPKRSTRLRAGQLVGFKPLRAYHAACWESLFQEL